MGVAVGLQMITECWELRIIKKNLQVINGETKYEQNPSRIFVHSLRLIPLSI